MKRVILFLAIISAALLAAGCGTDGGPAAAPGTTPVAVNGSESCASCHGQVSLQLAASLHGQAGVTCADCHSNLDAHQKRAQTLPTTDVRGETCASCHADIHAEWASSPHALIPLDLLPNDARIMQCMKCHQGSGFAAVIESGNDFKSSWGPPPATEPEAVTCIACHSPHKPRDSQLLRLPKGELCATCHGGKWQNQVLTATPADPYTPPRSHGGFVQGTAAAPTHPYRDSDYTAFANHPHNGGDRCVTCHMARTPGVDTLGGHTFSMRSDNGGLQNTGACAACHGPVDSYDIGGRQTEVRQALTALRQALERRNNGALPGNQPGTCNECHKGGSLPFDDDPDLILGNAYEAYKQIDRDKSLGVHNAPFALEVLRESLDAVEQLNTR